MENADLWKDYQVNTKNRQRGTCSFSAKKNSLNRKELKHTFGNISLYIWMFAILDQFNLFSDKPLYETFVHLCSTKFIASFY